MANQNQLAVREREFPSSSAEGWVVPNLLLPSALMRPTYLKPSAWAEHIPFAFWLVEALSPRVLVELGSHYGTSYFAFCQAIDRLGLASNCFAVDTWRGDEHAGFYGDEVYDTVRKHNAAQYSRFSTLVKSSFDEALGYFEDGTIDLLHIDGLHTLEAVSRDFESWLPKMSSRGVVVMHDTNVRERGFGVYKLFAELRSRFRHFEFVHGHGLGVLGVGPEVAPALCHLFDQQEIPNARREIQELFARLGRDCYSELQLVRSQDSLTHAKEDLDRLGEDLKQVRQALGTAQTSSSTTAKEVAEIRRKYNELFERTTGERGQFEERVRLLTEMRDELRQEVARLQAKLDERSIPIPIPIPAPAPLMAEIVTSPEVGLKIENESLHARLAERFNEIAVLTKILGQTEATLADRNGKVVVLERELAAAKGQVNALERELVNARAQVARQAEESEELRAVVAASRGEVAALLSSTSWRVMAPVRWIVSKLKQLF
ncbi:MAG TPA: hypothetical protein DDZ67_00840 [Xanthomonadaceae bacterium]|nr:hypothetical protein [Xanthomonadaceae bacterium]